MYRVLPVLLLVLSGCSDPGAVQARIQFDPDVQATCIALDLLSNDGTVLKTQLVPRPEGKNDANIGVFRGDFPQDIQLQARALWGTECQEPLFYNGKSQAAPVSFKSGDVVTMTLSLSRPAPREDVDGDGFVATALGGPDCDDARGDASPKAQQEVCDASADLNCNGRLGCDDALCSNTTCSRVATSLSFKTSPISAGVGDCVAVTVERRDQNGQPANPNYRTEFQPSASNLEGLFFHSDSDCKKDPLSTVSIDEKQTAATFYVRGIQIDARQLLATSTGLERASLNYTLSPGSAAQIAILSPAKDIDAGSCSDIILQRQDEFGNPTTSGSKKTVTLSIPTATAQTAFYSGDSSCGPSEKVTQADFPGQSSSLKLKFKSERANVFALKFTGLGPELTQNQTVRPLSPSQVELSLPSPAGGKTLLADECSPKATVKTLDVYGNDSSPAAGTTVSLIAPAENNVTFFSGAGCNNSGPPVAFDGTANTADFYFKVKSGGAFDLKALLSTGFESTPQSVTVAPTVRRNQCTLLSNADSVDCPISPKLNDLNKSFLVFQATSNSDEPQTSFVRCQLKNESTIGCKRYSKPGPEVHIQWQVVELATGLKVQHLPDATCSNKGASISIPQSIDHSKAFLLLSSSHSGKIASANDFVTVQFNSDFSAVDVVMDPKGSCDSDIFSLQVVEFDGASVTRNTTDQMKSGVVSPIEVSTSFTLEDASHSILLSTFQTPHENEGNICNRMVRGEIGLVANKLHFSRGASAFCNVPEIPVIAWERIQFPAKVVVQQKVLEAIESVGVVTASILAVDTTRTLLLTSSQVSSGQGNGETSHTATDSLGVGTGRLRFNSSTEVALTRDDTRDTSRWTVYAVEFNP